METVFIAIDWMANYVAYIWNQFNGSWLFMGKIQNKVNAQDFEE